MLVVSVMDPEFQMEIVIVLVKLLIVLVNVVDPILQMYVVSVMEMEFLMVLVIVLEMS